ncbi:MAG TPA: HypC/HybG/HupF family hydrogenase formation chaperone [Candidatus Limnocylindria bacterium]
MCLGVAGKVVDINAERPEEARVEIEGVAREVSLSMLETPVQVGDWVLVHLGFALQKLTAEEAAESQADRRAVGLGPDEDEADGAPA